MMRTYLFLLLFISCFTAIAQPNFVDVQKTNPRVATAYKNRVDTLEQQFNKAGLSWPPQQLYIRSFKYDSQLEIWVRNNSTEAYKLFKSYKVCALSGSLGPKRIEGDYQVPEGFYYINIFNPKSTYHLSLGLNYPNASDELLSDSAQPGGEIFIHGSCVTVGCIPIQNHQIEDVYLLASYAKNNGQDFIPVHIFPIKFNNPKSFEYFAKTVKGDEDYIDFAESIKKVYDYFETYKKLPLITVNQKGKYVVLD
jgi:murein L,D-transpeptidase YafK